MEGFRTPNDDVYTKYDFCFSCINYGNQQVLESYAVQNGALRYMLQESQLTLCYTCKLLAQRTETFLHNLLTTRSLWQGDNIHTETMLKELKVQIKPTIKLSFSRIDTQEFNSELLSKDMTLEYDQLSPTAQDSDHESDLPKTILEDENVPNSIKVENWSKEPNSDRTSVADSKTSQESDAKRHIEAFKAAMRKSKSAKQEQTKYKIESFRQSRSDLMRERRSQAQDRKYLAARFRCELCVKGFTYRSAFEGHQLKHDKSNGEYKCSICHQRVDTLEKIFRHKKQHFLRYKCSACGIVRACRTTIKEHIVAHHSEGLLIACPHCPKTFTRPESRKKHIALHHRRRPRVGCRLCPKTFTTQSLLCTHLAMHHPDESLETPPPRPHQCPNCDKSFTAPSLLRKHMSKHTDKREYYCVECDKSFKSETHLKSHLRFASAHVDYNELRFPCEQCEKRFPVRRDLEKHMNMVHLKIKPFQCDKCDRAYSSKCSLSKHIQFTHNGKRLPKIPCSLCNKVFDKHVLTVHMRTHTGDRPYQCGQCTMSFAQSSVLSTHVKLVHLRLRRDGTKRET